jgi:acyl carrier protein
MTELTLDDAMAIVIDSIGAVAPDVEPELASLDRSADLFEELQLDSMDHLNVMTALAERTGVEIPEREYHGLRSLDSLSRYLSLAVGKG